MKPEYETAELEATSSLTISNASTKTISAIPIVLYHKLEVTAVRIPDARSLRFTQEVVPMADARKKLVKYVQIALGESLPVGATLTFDISYHGKLAGYAEAGQNYIKDHVDRNFTIIRFDCLAYPVVAPPSMASLWRSVQRDLAHGWDYLLEVTVPEEYVVANGGKLLEKRRAEGKLTYAYANIKPSWRIDAAIAKYGTLESAETATRVFFFPEDRGMAEAVLRAVGRCSRLYSDWFGPLQTVGGFSVIEVPNGYGSQADVTSILQEADAFKGQLRTFYHEVSHRWNPPPLDPTPSRFESEGLACFLEGLLEETLDQKEGSLQKSLAQYRERFRAQCRQNPKLKDVPIAQYGKENCTEASYTKGPIAFWILYRILGEEAFMKSYSSFCRQYEGKGATLAEFAGAITTVSGKGLQKYFDEWIYGAKSSEYLLNDLSLAQILQTYIAEQGAPVQEDSHR